MGRVAFSDIYPDGPGSGGGGGGGGAGGSGVNDMYPGMPVGASPVNRDITIAAATGAAGVVIWQPAADRTFVLASAMISTDTAMRIALVDGADVQGQRPVDGYFGANGGASPNLVPVPYPSKLAGQPLRVVTAALGNVKVAIRGWEQ